MSEQRRNRGGRVLIPVERVVDALMELEPGHPVTVVDVLDVLATLGCERAAALYFQEITGRKKAASA